MNRNLIKYIAAAAMFIDHISAFFIPITTPLGVTMRVIGRLTAPTMCFFLAEGFHYTSSKKKYGTRLFIFAVISQFAYVFANSLSLQTPQFNMLFTLFLGFLILLAYEKISSTFLKTIVIFILIASSFFSDWGIIAPMWILSFHILRNEKGYKFTVFSLISIMHIIISTVNAIAGGFNWYAQLWQMGVFLFVPIMLCYNGRQGKNTKISKWFFYIFYPLHLYILGLIQNFA